MSQRRRLRLRLTSMSWAYAATAAYVLAFLALPLGTILIQALGFVALPGPPLPDGFVAHMLRITWNSVLLGTLTATVAVAVSLPLAVFLTKVALPGAWLLEILMVVPLITPPFISAFATVLLLGKTGVITQLLAGIGFEVPSIYGLSGLLITDVLHFVPLAVLTISAGLRIVPADIEEAALSLGGRSPGILVRIVLPYVAPHMLTAFALVFLSSFGDVGAPLLLAGNFGLLTLESYTSFMSAATDSRIPVILSAWAIVLSVVILQVVRTLMHRTKQAHTFSVRSLRHRGQALRWLGFAYCGGVIGILLLPYLAIAVASLATVWGTTLLPDALTLRNYVGLTAMRDPLVTSIILATVATPLCVVLAVVLGHILHRFPRATAVFDYVVLLPFVLPGVVIAIGLMKVYAGLVVFGLAVPLAGTWALLAISYSVRRLPLGLRIMVVGYSRIDRTLEETSVAFGASAGRTFLRITVPQLLPAIGAATTIAFIRIISELGATLVLYPPGWETLSVAILQFASEGNIGVAAAGSILMVLLTVTFTLLSKLQPFRVVAALRRRFQMVPGARIAGA